MRRLTYLIIFTFLCGSLSGCAYENAYRAYAVAQSTMATASGPLVEFDDNGKIKSIGNPMLAMAMVQMKPPKSEAAEFFDWLKLATPFGAIWGIVGAMSTANRGATTTVSGEGNFVGNTASGGTSWASPPTTNNTTNNTTNSTSNAMLPDGLVVE